MIVLLLSAAFAADLSEGALAYGVCVSCHGAHGEGREALGAPRIGDLEAGYIAAQLRAFRDGGRGQHPDDAVSGPMRGVAAGMDDALIDTVAAYAAGLSPQLLPAGPAVEDARYRGYQTCAACHGDDATGNAMLQAPSLLYQDPGYLDQQLTAFRDGVRGGPGAPAMGLQMAAMASGLSDADIDQVVAYIASLRPEVPPVEDPEVTLSEAEGLAAFADIYAVVTHPRCMNCHPAGDVPLQTDDSVPHVMGITRFSPLQGEHCSTCHPAAPVGDGLAPLPPADPVWSMPPAAMAFQGRSAAALCAQLKDPSINGGRGLTALTQHIAEDHLLATSWHSGRTPPPISHDELVQRFTTWAAAGGPCPE